MNEIHAAEIAAAISGALVGSLLTLAACTLRAVIEHRRKHTALRDGKILRGIRP